MCSKARRHEMTNAGREPGLPCFELQAAESISIGQFASASRDSMVKIKIEGSLSIPELLTGDFLDTKYTTLCHLRTASLVYGSISYFLLCFSVPRLTSLHHKLGERGCRLFSTSRSTPAQKARFHSASYFFSTPIMPPRCALAYLAVRLSFRPPAASDQLTALNCVDRTQVGHFLCHAPRAGRE
jgi:hypothetical protein